MTTFLALLTVVLFVFLIVGLVKPKSILRWDSKPTRPKIFGYWLLSNFIIIVAIAVIGVKDDSIPAKQQPKAEMKNTDSLSQKKQVAATPIDVKPINKVDEAKAKLKEDIERELKSIEDGVNFSIYRGDIESLQIEIVLFNAWAKFIVQGDKSNDPEIKKLVSKLRTKVVSLQKKEFPILRKEYGKIVANKLWENDIEVSANGAGYKIINFSGGVFAANKNKQDFQTQVQEILKLLRFSQARYRWYKGADEYTFWNLSSNKDTDIIIIN